jgi:hypothetical protein
VTAAIRPGLELMEHTMATARMMLACQYCGERWPDDAVMEAMALHTQVEHDTDDYRLDLILVCACNTTMTLTRSEPLRSGRVRLHFDCPSCKRSTTVTQDQRT